MKLSRESIENFEKKNLKTKNPNFSLDPDDLIEFIYCSCKKNKCATNQCMCFMHNIQCSDLCTCIDCENDEERDEESGAMEEVEEEKDEVDETDEYMPEP